MINRINLFILVCASLVCTARSWNTDELEVFDAVEEIKQNLYTLLKVSQTDDIAKIKKSFRKLSLELHPDKNPSPNADEEFRHAVLAYETLKSPEKRKYYDYILEHGMPDWRQAVYYYRRVRKMGLLEMCLILAVIVSVGQYLVAWASYMENIYTLKELLKSRDKRAKRMKKSKNESSYSDQFIESTLQKPSVKNTLPFQICFLIKGIVVHSFRLCFALLKQPFSKEEKSKPAKEQTRQSSKSKKRSSRTEPPPPKPPKKPEPIPEIISSDGPPETTGTKKPQKPRPEEAAPTISGGLWTDDDILELIKLVKKHPAGEPERWNKIAIAMARSVPEVTHMVNKIKDNDFRVPSENEETAPLEPEPKKVKTRGGKLGVKLAAAAEAGEEEAQASVWTQVQQKAFETALNKYSKKCTDDRWERIANCVPGKTKEDCILRYKKIAEMVRQKKASTSPSEEEENKEDNEVNENNLDNEDQDNDTNSS